MSVELDKPPIRLCCMERHWGAVCPDGKVMCCICFDRFDQDQLFVDADGQKWDICLADGEREREHVRLNG